MSERIADDECEGLVRLIVESYRDAPNPSVDIAVEEIMRTFYDYARLSSPVPAPEDTPDERISAIRQRCEAATPGPWVCEVQIREREESAHYQIRTVEPQPSHPWSPRFLAWMMGGRSIAPNVFKSLSPWQQSNLVDEGLRDDRKVEPDAQFIAHAREDVPWLLAEVSRLRSQVQRMEADRVRIDQALENCGIGGIFDIFESPADAITQMAAYIQEHEDKWLGRRLSSGDSE